MPGHNQSQVSQLAEELKSFRVDWAVGLHGNRDKFTLWSEFNILDHMLDADKSAVAPSSQDVASIIIVIIIIYYYSIDPEG